MKNENIYSMVTHYNGQAFLSARMDLEEGQTDSAEEARRKLIRNLRTLKDDENLRRYIQFLENSQWDRPEKVDEASEISEELIIK